MNSYERVKKDAKEKYPQWSDGVIELTAGLVPMLATSLLEEIAKKKEIERRKRVMNDAKTIKLIDMLLGRFDNMTQRRLTENQLKQQVN